jgi:cytochrome P450/NADPH-cytochrome P450 reductase
MQEATLVLGMILQQFELVDHLRYELTIKETLTQKPDEFHIQIKKRARQRVAQ